MEILASCFWCERVHPAQHALSLCPTCVAAYRARRFPLGPLEMRGSFPLDDAKIDEMVCRTSPGNYALGYLDGDSFVVFYVGRSDRDVRRRLHEWVGMPSRYERWAASTRAPWRAHRRTGFPVDAPAAGRVGSGASSYTRFAFSYATSAEDAFEKECRNYDDFGGKTGLDNRTPPSAAD